MDMVIIAMLIGICLGVAIFPKKWAKANSRIQMAFVLLILFSMGMGLGGNAHFFENVKEAGLQALGLSLATIGGSVLLVYIFTRLVPFKKNSKGDAP